MIRTGKTKMLAEQLYDRVIPNTHAYRRVLEHRKQCKKWGKDFCIDCFGGGLNQFSKDAGSEVFVTWITSSGNGKEKKE